MSVATPTAPPEMPAGLVDAVITRATAGRFGGPYTFDEQWKLAEGLAKAHTAIPPIYRGSPGDVLAAITQAHALDVPVSLALQHLYFNPDSGKGGMSAQLMSALMLRQGVTWKVTRRDTEAVAMFFERADGGPGGEVTWTILEAVAAGLIRPGSPWEFYPVDCLWARCLSRGARQFAADAVLGMGYTPEEVFAGASDDAAAEAGKPVDPRVAEVLASAVEASADDIQNAIIPNARKAGLLTEYAGSSDGVPRTLLQALQDRWLAASHREAAAAADAALPAPADSEFDPTLGEVTGEEPAGEPPAEAAPAGSGTLKCGCVAQLVLASGEHRGGCPGA